MVPGAAEVELTKLEPVGVTFAAAVEEVPAAGRDTSRGPRGMEDLENQIAG